MKSARLTSPAVACLTAVAVLATLTLGPFMHETDQGWLLDGGVAIADGHWDIARADFNFDKQYISYLLPGILFRLFARPLNADALVVAGNILAMIFFWGAILWVLVRSSRRLPLALALSVILTPAFLVHSAFYASAFISGAFVIWLAGFLDRQTWTWPRQAIAGLLAFCAVGARVDALLVLPLLAMLHSPRRTLMSALKSPNTWLLAVAGLAAVLSGRALASEPSANSSIQHFNPKQFLAYIVFGFGGAGVLFAVVLHAIWSVRGANRCRLWLALLSLGLVLPAVYYCPQLLSPRHCTLAALATLVFICARSGRAILQIYLRNKVCRQTLKFILLVSALTPLFVGVNLTDLRHPQLTCWQPTLFPTAAGASPMGAYLGHALNVRRLHGLVDQNQAIWAAARDTDYKANADGNVALLRTPAESYLHLAVHVQGKQLHVFSFPHDDLPSFFYVDSRSLMRFQYSWSPKVVSPGEFFDAVALNPATATSWHGVTILLGETHVPPADSLSAPLWVFNEAFGGDEFRLEPAEALRAIPADWGGRRLVSASRNDFALITTQTVKAAEMSSRSLGRWRICEIRPLRAGEPISVRRVSPGEIYVAISALPECMSLKRF